MSARTVFRMAALVSIGAGLIAVPSSFLGNDELFLRAGWVWVIASIVMILARRRMRAGRTDDKETKS